VGQGVAEQGVQLGAHLVLGGIGLALQPRQKAGVDEGNAGFSASVCGSVGGVLTFHESTKKVKR
jgi:hypothetical protein